MPLIKPLLFISFAFIVACSDDSHDDATGTDANPYAGYASDLYDGVDNWLCRPDIDGEDNVCARDLTTTLVFADGSTQIEPAPENDSPPADCFYVYPTVSLDATLNSDFSPGREITTAYVQAARYREACSVFAPLYRQVTLSGLGFGGSPPGDWDLAYGDVLDAFKQFIANAGGRDFILIGHSQGSAHLMRLISEEIENQPWLAQRMIAAHLIGITVARPLGEETGASFASTPPCTNVDDTGCFVNYASFKVSEPPDPAISIFGVTEDDDTRASCTNPNRLGGGRLALDAYFDASGFDAYTSPALNATISTPFVNLPGLVSGECIESQGIAYLAISVDADPNDPRTDEVGGESLTGWGLHLRDMDFGMGDLVQLARTQIEARQQ